MKGVNVEAVLRVEDDEENGGKRKNKSKQKEVEDDLGLSMLIDSQNNQYVLTKPRDSTMPRADHHFIKVSFRTFFSFKSLIMQFLIFYHHVFVATCVSRTWCRW